MSQRDYYEVLGLSRSAKPEQVKRAYRQLAKKFHPDHYKGKDSKETKEASAKFNEVQEAYSILSDPEKRKLYDQFGHAGPQGGGPSVAQRVWRTGQGGFDVRDFTQGGGGGFESVFEQFFGRGRRPGRPAKPRPTQGQDITKKITLPFTKAALGTKSTLRLRTGAGKTQTLETKIPPGVADGSRIRIRGKGRASATGGPAGDLYLQVSIEPHKYFWREGRDIYIELPISYYEAAAGTKVDVPTLQGTSSVNVPPGVNSGQKLRLREKGIPPATPADQKGHQYVVIKIVSPPKLNAKAKDLLKEFDKECDYKPERFQ